MTKKEYDVDLIDSYVKLDKLWQNSRYPLIRRKIKRLLESIKLDINNYCQDTLLLEGKSFYKERTMLVIPSYEKAYVSSFSWSLALIDLEEIDEFLSYQFENYEGNHEPKDGFVKFANFTCRSVRSRSIIETQSRLDRIKTWVKENKIRKQLADSNPLEWTSPYDLKRLSKKLSHKKCTKTPLAFYKALVNGIPTKWLLSLEILAHFIYKLREKGLIIRPGSKGYFKSAEKLFVDYTKKSNQKIRLHEINSRIVKNPKAHKATTDFVDDLLYGI